MECDDELRGGGRAPSAEGEAGLLTTEALKRVSGAGE